MLGDRVGVGEPLQGGFGDIRCCSLDRGLDYSEVMSEGTGKTILALGRLKIPAVPLTCCVILGKLLNQSELQFSYLLNGSVLYPIGKELFLRAKWNNAYEILSMVFRTE